MSSLKNRRIVVAISGGIAAYKVPELVRRLKDQGAEVRVVMTSGAKAFITPLTLQAVSGQPVHDNLLDPEAEAAMGHIELAKWADLIVVAPASASVMARLAHGLADDLLTTLCLATAAPIAIVPAMNQQMWAAMPTQRNLALLQQDQKLVWGPAEGSQACGDVGAGRMLEAAQILVQIQEYFSRLVTGGLLSGKKIMITAGPTREPLDPVRYLTNHSSGKMGFALAQAAAEAGAEVTLISGPVQLPTPSGVQRKDVVSAADMLAEVKSTVTKQDVFIGCAAVADFRPVQVASEKLKKQHNSDNTVLELVKTVDILATVAALENAPYTCGFAAETQNVHDYAQQKLKRKGIHMIAANDVSNQAHGFNSDTNAIDLFWLNRTGDIQHQALGQGVKEHLARLIIQYIATQLTNNNEA